MMSSEEHRSPDKTAKKAGRKQAKALGLLAKDYHHIGESDGPSPNILVCNAGLVTGCSQAVFRIRSYSNRRLDP